MIEINFNYIGNMTLKQFFLTVVTLICLPLMAFGAQKSWSLSSPDGRIFTETSAGDGLKYSVSRDDVRLLSPSEISMTFENGMVFGGTDKVRRVIKGSQDVKSIPAMSYKKASVDDVYNFLTLEFKGYNVEFRAFDNEVAYRFISTANSGEFTVTDEHIHLSEMDPARLAFLPMTVDAVDWVKIIITESDLTGYPVMFLNGQGGKGLKSVRAPYPTGLRPNGVYVYQNMDYTGYIAGEIGEYVAVAHRSGDTWHVGALTNWDARDLILDLNFIGSGDMTVFQDGINAYWAARDYKKTRPETIRKLQHRSQLTGW